MNQQQTSTVVIGSKSHAALKRLCAERGLKLGALATRIIEEYLNENFRTSRKKTSR